MIARMSAAVALVAVSATVCSSVSAGVPPTPAQKKMTAYLVAVQKARVRVQAFIPAARPVASELRSDCQFNWHAFIDYGVSTQTFFSDLFRLQNSGVVPKILVQANTLYAQGVLNKGRFYIRLGSICNTSGLDAASQIQRALREAPAIIGESNRLLSVWRQAVAMYLKTLKMKMPTWVYTVGVSSTG